MVLHVDSPMLGHFRIQLEGVPGHIAVFLPSKVGPGP